MSMNTVIPAILVHNEDAFRQRLSTAEMLAPLIQIDVMDGSFVAQHSWYDPYVLRTISTSARFELHLMVLHPEHFIENARLAGAAIQRILWHIEVNADHADLLKRCAQLGYESGLAIAPGTSIEQLVPHASTVSEFLVLGVSPGFSGQSLLPATIDTARRIHERWPRVPLAFDGGVNTQTLPRLREAGVERFCVASALFDAQDPVKEFQKLQQL